MHHTLVNRGSFGTINLNHCFHQRLQEARAIFLPKSEVGVALVEGLEIKIHRQAEEREAHFREIPFGEIT